MREFISLSFSARYINAASRNAVSCTTGTYTTNETDGQKSPFSETARCDRTPVTPYIALSTKGNHNKAAHYAPKVLYSHKE